MKEEAWLSNTEATFLFLLSSPMGSTILQLLLQCQDLASTFVLKILEEMIVF